MISACLIVRNEEQVIARCLASLDVVLGADGEVCIVDTGSTDHTADAIRAMQGQIRAEVRYEPSVRWHIKTPPSEFHFAEARNEALFLARKPLSMWLDADDVLDGPTSLGILDLLRTRDLEKVPAWRWAYVMPDGSEYMRVRMWWTRHRMRFRGACHEYLPPPDGTVNLRALRVYHQPPERKPDLPRAAGTLRIDLLRKEAEEQDWKDPRTIFYLANEMRTVATTPDARKATVEMYNRYLAISTWPEERSLAFAFAGTLLQADGQNLLARQCFAQAHATDPRFAEAMIALIYLDLAEGKKDAALVTLAKLRLMPFPADTILFTAAKNYMPETHDAIEKEIMK